MGDKNLVKDKFFRDQISTGKDGYIAITHFLNCNNVKTNKWTVKDIIDACKDSQYLEFEGETVRRAGNNPLPVREVPAKTDVKKRDQKAESKAAEQQEDEYDEDGKVILCEKDFDNPIIVTYETVVASGEEFEVDWKEVEKGIKTHYPKLKLIYSRKDPHGGQVAFSQLRIKKDLLENLCSSSIKIQDRDFKFKVTEGEDLKEFWQKHGGHYTFCI